MLAPSAIGRRTLGLDHPIAVTFQVLETPTFRNQFVSRPAAPVASGIVRSTCCPLPTYAAVALTLTVRLGAPPDPACVNEAVNARLYCDCCANVARSRTYGVV